MIIMVFIFKTLEEFRTFGKDYEVPRPSTCPDPACGRCDCFWKQTAYSRDVLDNDEVVVRLRIQRFKCRYCDLVVSCLFSFLVPYRRYSAQVVAGTAETYVTAPVGVPLKSYRNIAENKGCGRMSVFRWTEILAKKASGLQCQLQKEFMLRARQKIKPIFQGAFGLIV